MESQISALTKDFNDKIAALEMQASANSVQNNLFQDRQRQSDYQSQPNGNSYRAYAPRTQQFNTRRGFSAQPRYTFQNNGRFRQSYSGSNGFRGPRTYQYHQNANTDSTPYFDSSGNARFHVPVIYSAETILLHLWIPQPHSAQLHLSKQTES